MQWRTVVAIGGLAAVGYAGLVGVRLRQSVGQLESAVETSRIHSASAAMPEARAAMPAGESAGVLEAPADSDGSQDLSAQSPPAAAVTPPVPTNDRLRETDPAVVYERELQERMRDYPDPDDRAAVIEYNRQHGIEP